MFCLYLKFNSYHQYDNNMRRKWCNLTMGLYRNSVSKQNQEALQKYYRRNEKLPGYCNQKQSLNFSKLDPKVHPSNWLQPRYIEQKLKLSSIGIGTQTGQATNQGDYPMFQILAESIKSGRINVIDTDINFRFGKSEKTINAVLNHLHFDHQIPRSSVFIASKCGYIPNDIDSNLDEKQFTKLLVDQGYISHEDIVNQIHCMHPNFIQFSVEKSLLSLGLDTIDLMYLNNPTESQQTVIGEKEYFQRLEKAFECLEQLRVQNKIRYYGIASFVSFRSPPNEAGIHADLHKIVKVAQKIGGNKHGLRFVLVPFNLGMPEILMKWQIGSKNTQEHIFTIAQQLGVHINMCCPLYQGRVANLGFTSTLMDNIKNNSAKHLQFIRSVPKQSVCSTIFSTLNLEHLKQNLEVTEHHFLTDAGWRKILPM